MADKLTGVCDNHPGDSRRWGCYRIASAFRHPAPTSKTPCNSTRRSRRKEGLLAPQHGRRVLVIEDSFEMRLLMKLLLDGEGYETLDAGDGQEALLLLESLDHLPSALLLDLRMAGMDGLEFRDEQRKRKRIADIPVLVLTAGQVTASEAERLAPCEFLLKPIDVGDLLSALDRNCQPRATVISHGN